MPVLLIIALVIAALTGLVIYQSSYSPSSYSPSSYSEDYVIYDRDGVYTEKCPLNYRAIYDSTRDAPLAGERCQLCQVDMAASQRERIRQLGGCSHASRQYGVSLCDQATMMTQSHA